MKAINLFTLFMILGSASIAQTGTDQADTLQSNLNQVDLTKNESSIEEMNDSITHHILEAYQQGLQNKYLGIETEDQDAALVVSADVSFWSRYAVIIQVFLGTIAMVIFIGAWLTIERLKNKLKESQKMNDSLTIDLDRKKKEVTSYSLNFIQKNELLEELNQRITELKKKPTDMIQVELTKLKRLVNSNLNIDNDWENFKLFFEETHNDFFTKLKKKYEDLTNSELRLCALLRLGMNLKESSKILGIAPNSVKTARFRLRKKLGLAHEDNLIDFLMRFDDETKLLKAS